MHLESKKGTILCKGFNVTAKGTDSSIIIWQKRKYHNIHKGLRQPSKKELTIKTGLPTLETRLPFSNTIIYNLDVVGIIEEP